MPGKRSLTATLVAASALGLSAAAHAAPRDIPADAPPAAHRAEPSLPKPRAWRFPEAFPRTSGTGRHARGAYLWTDFIYDDHGASGPGFPDYPTSLAAPDGRASYPAGPALANGADIFRVGIGRERRRSVWRIDWNTLADPAVPIALFALDTDATQSTGTSSWAAGANVRSPGSERFLLVSARGAWLYAADGRTRRVAARGRGLSVDRRSRSFVARIPTSRMPVGGRWVVRLAAGLADASGREFAVPPGGAAGDARAYNLGFRSVDDEPQRGNFWMEDRQAAALAERNAAPFAALVDWRDLRRRRTTPERIPRGYSNRWYASSIAPGPGQGVQLGGGTDGEPNFFGRVQPYAVYVPGTWRRKTRSGLIWMLHSLSVQHNQYGALNPRYVRELCEREGRICATTLGRGPDGWYTGEAELDFWEVWAAIARDFRLDPTRTVISGYSMGGYGTYRLGLSYPGAFSRAISHAGPPANGIRVLGPLGAVDDPESDTAPLLPNALHVPFYVGQGVLDQLVPFTGVAEHVSRMDALGNRYTFDLYPAEDHLLYAAQDGFSAAASVVDYRRAPRNPARIAFDWHASHLDRRNGLGPRRAYWVTRLRAADRSEGSAGSLRAQTLARPEPEITEWRSTEPILGDGSEGPSQTGLETVLGQLGADAGTPADLLSDLAADLLNSGDPAVGLRTRLGWRRGNRPDRRPRIALRIANVDRADIDVRRAGIRRDERFRVIAESDRRAEIRLRRIGARRRVSASGRARASRSGRVVLPGGRTTITVR